jgi:hypothetical protein
MRGASWLASLGLASMLGGPLACAPPAAPGDIRTFHNYDVVVEAIDELGINSGLPARTVSFNFDGHDPKSPSGCATFGDATATFAGRPVAIPDAGGWVRNRIPTNTAPGETINGDFCGQPTIRVEFDEPVGEPQDGVLAIDGGGVHLEVPFNHPFGSPAITLVSVAADKIVVGLQNFLAPPSLADVNVFLFDQSGATSSGPSIQKTALSADGHLELALPAGAITRPASATVVVSVNLGHDDLSCVGFVRCSASSRFDRPLAVDIPLP